MDYKNFGKAQLSAFLATAIDFLLTAILYKMTRNVMGSTLVGTVSGGAINCIINYLWAFKDTTRTRREVAWRYILVWLASLFYNTNGTTLAVKLAGAWLGTSVTTVMIIKATVAILVAFLWNYPMHKFYVYRK